MSDQSQPCRVCMQPATEVRQEVKTLTGGGAVVASHTLELWFCLQHALDYDAAQLARQLPARPGPAQFAPAPDNPDFKGKSPQELGIDPADPLVRRIALDDRPSRDLAMVWQSVLGVCYMASLVSVADVEALLAEYDRTDALMPILDPTGYKAIMGNIPQHRGIARAFLALRMEIAKHEVGE